MMFDISRIPEPEDYGEVLLRLMASPKRQARGFFDGAEKLPGAQVGDALILIGETTGDLGGSLYAREWLGLQGDALGAPTPVDPVVDKKNTDFVRALIEKGVVSAVYPICDGGLICTVADILVELGKSTILNCDCVYGKNPYVDFPFRRPNYAALFSERQYRFIVSEKQFKSNTRKQAEQAGIKYRFVGHLFNRTAHGPAMIGLDSIDDIVWNLPLSSLREAHQCWMTRLTAGG